MAIPQFVLAPAPDLRVQRILVATDFSLLGRHAVTRAGQIAKIHDAAVQVLHVVRPACSTARFNTLENHGWSDVAQFANASLRQEARRLRIEFLVSASGTLHFGEPADAIAQAANEHDAQLLIIGARGVHAPRLPATALGSTAVRLVSRTHRPFLLVRDSRPAAYQESLLAAPGSGNVHDHALEWASALTAAAPARTIAAPRDVRCESAPLPSLRDKVRLLVLPRASVQPAGIEGEPSSGAGAKLAWGAPLDMLLID